MKHKCDNRRMFNGMQRFLLGGLLIPILFGCGGCGEAVDPVAFSCQSDTCWDLSKSNNFPVNADPVNGQLLEDRTVGGRFVTVPGHTYTVRVKTASGTCHTYASSESVIDLDKNKLNDPYSNDQITFEADAEAYYLLVEAAGSGCTYSARVYSYDDYLEPLSGTSRLWVGDDPASYRLIPFEMRRFAFAARRGEDYTVKVTIFQGTADTYLSLIPSVDSDVYDLADDYSNSTIRFRAAVTGLYFVAVVDRGGATGSDFLIEVSSP